MDVHPAAAVDHCTGMAQCANDLLQFAHLAVLQLPGEFHLHFIKPDIHRNLMTMDTFGGLDAGIKDKPPLFAFPIYHFPWVIYC